MDPGVLKVVQKNQQMCDQGIKSLINLIMTYNKVFEQKTGRKMFLCVL